jgi:hypothetical protein
MKEHRIKENLNEMIKYSTENLQEKDNINFNKKRFYNQKLTPKKNKLPEEDFDEIENVKMLFNNFEEHQKNLDKTPLSK